MPVPVHNAIQTADTVVELLGVSKTFRQRLRSERLRDVLRGLLHPQIREVHALSEVNLHIARGEIIAYAGPNGAGKSTTIKLLCGLLHPDAGQVRILGMNPCVTACTASRAWEWSSGSVRNCGSTIRWRRVSSGSAWCGTSRAGATTTWWPP